MQKLATDVIVAVKSYSPIRQGGSFQGGTMMLLSSAPTMQKLHQELQCGGGGYGGSIGTFNPTGFNAKYRHIPTKYLL
jgi:hypothetical protein